jgi:hypothetical protein
MSFVHFLQTRGVSPAGAQEFVTSGTVTRTVDRIVLRRLRLPKSPVVAATDGQPQDVGRAGHSVVPPSNPGAAQNEIEALKAELAMLEEMLKTLRRNPPDRSVSETKWADWRDRIAEIEARMHWIEARLQELKSQLSNALLRDRHRSG